MSRVSVVLCSYNQAQYLPHAIESVFQQTHPDVELVIVDNGSSDASQEIMKRHADDPRVKLLMFPDNQAVGKRLNAGIRASTGEYISILYSDDYYLPHKLASQVAIFEKLPPRVGIVYSPGMRHDVRTDEKWKDPSPTVSGNIFHDLLTQSVVMHPITPLVRRECFEKYPFLEDIFVEGEGIFIRMALKYHFHFDPEITAVMRDTPSNIGRAVRRNTELAFIAMEKLERDPDFPEHERQTLEDMRTWIYKAAGWQAIRVMEDGKWGREMLLKGVRHKPSILASPRVLANLLLTFAPKPALGHMNRVLNRLRGYKGNMNYVPEEKKT